MKSYLPTSLFLRDIISGRLNVEGSSEAENNIPALIALLSDEDVENRDWAAFIISNIKHSSFDLRAPLLLAAEDRHADVRDEAILGLARIDREAALERLEPLLSEEIGIVLLEAAAVLGEPSLVHRLEAIRRWEGVSDYARELLERAIKASKTGKGVDCAEKGYRLSKPC